MPEPRWDVFISHASEDLRSVALPLAEALRQAGLRVWLDDSELTLGDKLRARINDGLAHSDFGIVILSPDFLAKAWPRDELHALMALEEGGRKRLLPLRHRLTQAEVTAADPLLGTRLSLPMDAGWDAVVSAVQSAIGAAGGRVAALPTGEGILVDFSHDQRQWRDLEQAFDDRRRYTRLTQGVQSQRELLDAARVLIVPPPFHTRLQQPEMEAIRRWVDAGGGLLILGCYGERHHASNISELAWQFDLEFGDDLVLPAGSNEHHARAQVFSRDAGLAAVCGPFDDTRHPLLDGVQELRLLSAATVRPTTRAALELVLHSRPDALRLRPLGHIEPDGSRPAIDEWLPEGSGPQPMLVAKRHGKGRVAAAGSWKLCTLDAADNRRMLDQLYAWLAAGG